MKGKKVRLLVCALSLALFASIGGGVSSISQSGGQGVEVQAAVQTPAQTTVTKKTEAELEKIVTDRFPGKVLYKYRRGHHGIVEYCFLIQQTNGVILEVKITETGYIRDVDFEGYMDKNGQYYDEDYFDWD